MSDYFTLHDDVLENKLGISDPNVLKQLEEEIVPFRTAEVFSSFHAQSFDFECLKEIHRRLFSDLYEFAGKVRVVDMKRGDNTVPFCYVQFIASEQARIFGTLSQEHEFIGLEREPFIKKLVWLAGELNALHPFRDGNGRAIRCFLVLLAAKAGYELDYSRVTKEELIEADIKAFCGDNDKLQNLYTRVLV
jgi:cell filamentation protein